MSGTYPPRSTHGRTETLDRNQRFDSWLAILREMSGRPGDELERRQLIWAAECVPDLAGVARNSMEVSLTRCCADFWERGLVDFSLKWHGGSWFSDVIYDPLFDEDEDSHIEQVLGGLRSAAADEREDLLRERHRLIVAARASGTLEDATLVMTLREIDEVRRERRIRRLRLTMAGWHEGTAARARLAGGGIRVVPVWVVPQARMRRYKLAEKRIEELKRIHSLRRSLGPREPSPARRKPSKEDLRF